MIQEAYVQSLSTRSVNDLVRAMGMEGISRSQVSRLCAEIDEHVRDVLARQIAGDWPYLWLDATYVKVREAGRIVPVAVAIAVGSPEAEPFWLDFLCTLKRRGLAGVRLVVSDAHGPRRPRTDCGLAGHPFCPVAATAGPARRTEAAPALRRPVDAAAPDRHRPAAPSRRPASRPLAAARPACNIGAATTG